MRLRRLIVNADDCNLTTAVTRGILQAHDQGIVTSTTLLVNLPLASETIRALKKRPRLGLGLHLNITLGTPVSRASRVRSLLKGNDRFRRPEDYLKKFPLKSNLICEYEAQIQLFRKIFATKPDHLDTHHHLHDCPVFFEALREVARRWKLPIRRSRIFELSDWKRKTKGLRTTDFLFGNLEANFPWRREPFLGIVDNLPEGTSEIACHPGICDAELRQMSSLRESREIELKLFSDGKLRKLLKNLGIEPVCFNEI